MYEYKALVTNVVDGDTFDAEVDLGFHTFTHQRFRMLGINAPELKGATREAGEASKRYLKALIGDETVMLRTYREKQKGEGTDSFGRWLAQVFEGTNNINTEMITSGHAVAYREDKL